MNRKQREQLRRVVQKWGPWVAGAIGVMVIGGITVGSRIGLHRVETSPEYCKSCHTDSGHLRGHEKVTCQTCHPLPSGERMRFVWAIVDPDEKLPEHGEVDQASCAKCHRQNRSQWHALMHTKGHETHAADPNALACTRCHATSLHGKPRAQEGCMSCHSDVPLESEPRSESQCILCHVFGRDVRRSIARWTPAGQDVDTWSNQVTVEDVHGAADCGLCHNPHEPPPKANKMPKCTSCHRGKVAATAALGPKEHARSCTGCHTVHGRRDELPTLCLNCHARPGAKAPENAQWTPGMPQPQPATVTGGVSKSIAPLSAEELKERTHQGRCPTCHEPHEFIAAPDVCKTCHEHQKQVDSLKALPKGVHEHCIGCHDPHQAPPTRDACLKCHNKPIGAGVPSKHKDCLSCHNPHSTPPTFAQACSASCHAEPRRGVQNGPDKHRNCGSCHTPHGNPVAGSLDACKNCHADKVSTFQGSPHKQCITCHVPHSFTPEAALARCASCHSQPTAPGAAHPGRCVNCHSVHGGPQRADNCATCHKDIQLRVSGHKCNGCHTPHAPKEVALTRCPTCHRAQAAATVGWPSDSPHAGKCMQCHTTHDVQTKKPCQSCHVKQANKAHMGVHPTCQGCHAPHKTPPATTAGWWDRCATCHTQEARAAAASIPPQHRECSNCHDHAERKAPACLSCHQDIETQFLHSEPNHRNCVTCHATHGARIPGRAQCISCHKDKRNHNPQAVKCQACHPFAQP